MEFNTTFSVIARCKKFRKDLKNTELFETEDITLTFNSETAGCMLFRFVNQEFFKLNEFNCSIKYNDNHKVLGVSLVDDNYIYIIKNLNQIFQQIHDGYIRLNLIDKLIDIMEFDFKAGLDIISPPEEEQF